MRYIKPPDFKSVKQLGEVYKKIEQDITVLMTTDASARTANELNQKIGQAISAAVSYLSNVNKDYSWKELPKAFKEGQNSVQEERKVLSQEEASAILEKQGFKYAKNGFSRDTYIELQNATKSAGNGLIKRVNTIIKDLAKTGQDTIYNVQQAILKDLQEHNVLEIEYSNGAKMPLSAYATMAARSARIESTNIGAIGRALQGGTDLVEMTTMPQCCKLCGAYQNKVYSISGKDKRFPALFKTVLKNGYALPHPNCRHEFIPYYEEIEDPEDVKKDIAKSKIKYDSKGNLVDVRYQKDIEAYQSWQAGNRQLNREMHEYEQMQAYYENKGEEAPYKTLGAFRRARRAQAQSYKDNRKEWSAKNEIAKDSTTNKYSVDEFNKDGRELTTFNLYEAKNEQERFDKTYEFYSKYQVGVANKDNFYYNSIAKFEDIGGRPKRPPDYVSYTRDGKVSSEYWYEGDTVIRGSDHWGNGVASCDWSISSKNVTESERISKTSKRYGKVKYSDIKFKTEVIEINGVKHFVGFDNVVDYKRGTRLYKIKGNYYINEGAATHNQFVKADYSNEYNMFFANRDEVLKAEAIEEKQLEEQRKKLEAEQRKNEEKQLEEQRKNEERHKELLKNGIFDKDSTKIPNVGDMFLTHDNQIVEIVGVTKLGGMVAVKLKNGKQYALRNIK